ncbi:MAG: zf-HC2 domain-containing protein [Armatimonadetes bacterium]|nr:zf-HC2 domain-containing protein [Armatimonadota bacterium]
MNRCSYYTNRFSDYIDQQLTAEERTALTLHLRECPACASEYAGFERAHSALQELATPLPSRPVLQAVRARIRQEEKNRRANLWRWAPVPALAAAAVAVFLVVLSHPGAQRSPFHSGNDVVASAGSRSSSQGSVVAKDATTGAQGADRRIGSGHGLADGQASLADRPALAQMPGGGVASASQPGGSLAQQYTPARQPSWAANIRRPKPRRAHIVLASRVEGPGPALAQQAQASGKVKYLVVAYQPSQDYSATVQDASSGRELGEMAVRRTLSADGTVKHANITLRFPPANSGVEDNDTKDDSTKIRSDIRSSFDDMVGRV